MAPDAKPRLIVLSGPPGTGGPALAHAIADAIPCPLISRDEIKEGMAHAAGAEFEAAAADPLTQRPMVVFFDVLHALLTAGVTVVAEAAFQDGIWRPRLAPLAELAHLRIVNCTAAPAAARDRALGRKAANPGAQKAHANLIGEDLEHWREVITSFDRISLDAPSLEVDTTEAPDIGAIVAFVNR